MFWFRLAVFAGSALVWSSHPASAQAPVFSDGFEDAETLADLFPPDGSRWTNFGVTTEENYMELSAEQVRSGEQSLKCYAAPYDGMTASKAYIAYQFLELVEGDEGWFQAWFHVESAEPTIDLFLWDLEATGTCTTVEACPEVGEGTICASPGRRLYLQNSPGTPMRSDLGKWCLGEDFVQDPGKAVAFPRNRWVRLRVFIGLSSGGMGIMQVWQDDALVLNHRGYTLPRADSIYDRLQVGITANGSAFNDVTLFLDDVSVWTDAPPWWLTIYDRNADASVTIDDLDALHKDPADLDGDGQADHADLDLLEAVLRWDELQDMKTGG